MNEITPTQRPRVCGIEKHLEGDGIVVFSTMRGTVEKLGGRPGWAAITARTTPKNRERRVEDFQAARLLGLALTYGAGAMGINLDKAKKLVILDRHRDENTNLQAEARVGPDCEIIRA